MARASARPWAGAAGAAVLRYELVNKDARTPGRPLLAHDIELDRGGAYLMRCDRVESSSAPKRCRIATGAAAAADLVHGTLELRIEGERDRVIKAGEAGFESGREPVYARASSTTPTSFIRCSILPLEILGRTSIMYVDPRDAGSKPRKYTVIIDQPIELPR